MANLVSIGNFQFPEPSEYEGTTSTMVDSARNTKGVVVGTVVRDDVAKVSLKWNFLTVSQWSNVLQQFNGKSKFYRKVKFFNQVTGKYSTRTMYVSDRTSSAFHKDKNGNLKGWKDCSLSLVEK